MDKKIEIEKRKDMDSYYLITEDEEGNKIAFEVDNPGK